MNKKAWYSSLRTRLYDKLIIQSALCISSSFLMHSVIRLIVNSLSTVTCFKIRSSLSSFNRFITRSLSIVTRWMIRCVIRSSLLVDQKNRPDYLK